ncbi:hypothetical protein D3Z36_12765 [Lachnospiraceae bacterium]|nr:hypothetical protein [Lachnospiraceae bacterium]
MDYVKMEQIYNRVYSTPPNSPERAARLAELSEEDNAALYDYSVGLLSGRIKKNGGNAEMEKEQRSYEWYKKKMEEADIGNMKIISQFSFDCPALYQSYRERYMKEQDEQRALRNRQLGENKHRNKPYSMR